jgi:hypothetical protein
MAYIGFSPSQLAVAPFAVKSFTGDGSTTTFTLDQSVPGANEANVEVVVENVQQNPIDAYTIGGELNNSLIFSEAPANGVAIYVIHKGEATYNLQPSTGSVTAATLDPVLRNFTVDNFTGNGSTTTYTLTDTPYSANSILVTVDGIVQTASTNYTVSGTTLSFGASPPDSGSVITVVHMGFSSGNKAVMDGSITPVKLSTGGPWWTTGGNFGVGTTTPALKVDVNGSIKMSGGSGTALTWDTAISSQYIKYDSTLDGLIMNGYGGLAYYTNGAERMRINSSGDLSVGATNSTGRITAIKTGKATIVGLDTTSSAASVGGTLDLGGNYRTSGDYQTFVRIAAEKTNATNADYGYNMGFYVTTNNGSTFGTKAITLTSTGTVELPYGQIKFPAVQNASSDANTLDDYEEGTWTPVLTAGTAPTGVTYSYRGGHYTKVGRLVNVTGGFMLSNKGTGGSGEIQISGLPFTNISYGGFQQPSTPVLGGNFTTASSAYSANFFCGDSATTLYGRLGNNSDTVWAWSEITNTTFIKISFTYMAA